MNDNLLKNTDGLITLLDDTLLLVDEIPCQKEAWLNLYVMAVAIYQESKWPRPHELCGPEFEEFEQDLRAWDRALIGQPEFKCVDVHAALAAARIDAVKMQDWVVDFCINGIHIIADALRAKNRMLDHYIWQAEHKD